MYLTGQKAAIDVLGLEKLSLDGPGYGQTFAGPRTLRESGQMARAAGAMGAGFLGAAAGAPGLARAGMGVGRHLLSTARAAPKTTTAVALGGAGLSALDGNSPGRVLADGLTAPVSWHGGFGAGSALGRGAAGAAGNLMSKVPGVARTADALGQRFPGAANFMRGMGRLGSETAGMSAMDSAGESAKRRMGR